MDSLRAALYDEAASIPPLGDIDRAIRKVSTSRRRWAGAIAVAVVALIAILGPWKAPALHVEPAVPEPIAPVVEILQGGSPMDTIRQSPLPDGADVAAAQSSPGRALVWSKGQPREVAVLLPHLLGIAEPQRTATCPTPNRLPRPWSSPT